MILKHGSLDGFFACLPRVKGQQGEDQGQAWRNLKPGYYLAISTKRA
jgi:hypothetical protein